MHWGTERAKPNGPVSERGDPCDICASRCGSGRWKLQVPTKEEEDAKRIREIEELGNPHLNTVQNETRSNGGRKKRRGRGKA